MLQRLSIQVSILAEDLFGLHAWIIFIVKFSSSAFSNNVRDLEVVLSRREYPEDCSRICGPSQFGPNNCPNPRTYPVNLIYY
jgi:hypothetical protein